MTQLPSDLPGAGRRTVLAAAGAAGLAAALAACGSDDKKDYTQGDTQGTAPQTPGAPAGSSAPETSTAPSAAAPGGGAELARTADIPEGGGKVFRDRKVVVTQPAKGEFKAFSAVCTHQGCVVGEVSGGTINCPCHGSKFAVADGSVRNGPAQRPLSAQRITVQGGTTRLA
ncbi:Rieske (2Fe-2S) protein [Streptomyces sp. UNOC14_S4]|uniref:Rieske (2Fe-2S) protein n=1 Tax=Streptomyces sp. UNOC14_S4 TaxID=2872340 RepID=UPI001E464567|nr:Rieske (2Fe-2S) protein [Streptomyces sp. UNOC14_S4]MCC3772585.1 Rieske (2Fe-2S) protein [Streptomyces sp. UNOC14_S4]